MPITTTDVVIIGGGAAGCAAAYYLALAGVTSTIVERQGIAAYASGYSAGGLNPLEGAELPGLLSDLAITSHRMHQAIWPDLADRSGIDFEPKVISSVRVAFADADLEDMRTTERLFAVADEDFTTEWLDPKQLRELEPRIAHDAICALAARGNAILSSYRYTLALAAAAQSLGAAVTAAAATGIECDGSTITAVKTSEGELACSAAVFATGPWSAQVGDWLDVHVPIEPYKGEILRTVAPGGALAADFQGHGVSLNHREDGQIWVGATEEKCGFDLDPSDAARLTLLRGAVDLMPCMVDAEVIMQTACLRPLSPDWLPIVGRAPAWDNAYLATGAGKKGILLSPAIGKAIADLITADSTDLPVANCGPDRFQTS